LASKADVNAKNSDGNTALHIAAIYGYKDMAEFLLASKADVNGKNNKGETPLRLALSKGHKDVAELLRQQGGHE